MQVTMTRIQQTFIGEIPTRPPFWFMRQAGRYLPEYREVRQVCGGFLDLCYNPEKAAQVTLQPIARFDMDAAIIFSDILVVPHAMGCEVGFEQGEGPKLRPLETIAEIDSLSLEIRDFLQPVYEALTITRKKLAPEKSLIGFSGAPWTLACYMLEGQGGGEFEKARHLLYHNAEMMLVLIEKLTQAVSSHLIAQVGAGADVLQIFDSWSGLVPAPMREALIFAPTRNIVRKIKQSYPKVPIIGFPRGQGSSLSEYVRYTGVDGVSVDTATSLQTAIKEVPLSCVIQGNLDPILLATHKQEMLEQAEAMLRLMHGRRYIFNLGHGILQQTPIAHVEALAAFLIGQKRKEVA